MQTFLGLSRVPPHKHLLNGPIVSVRWRLAFVLKEPICCYLHVSFIPLTFAMFYNMLVSQTRYIIFFEVSKYYFACEGQNMHSILVPGCLIRTTMYMQVWYAYSYHECHIFPCSIFPPKLFVKRCPYVSSSSLINYCMYLVLDL